MPFAVGPVPAATARSRIRDLVRGDLDGSPGAGRDDRICVQRAFLTDDEGRDSGGTDLHTITNRATDHQHVPHRRQRRHAVVGRAVGRGAASVGARAARRLELHEHDLGGRGAVAVGHADAGVGALAVAAAGAAALDVADRRAAGAVGAGQAADALAGRHLTHPRAAAAPVRAAVIRAAVAREALLVPRAADPAVAVHATVAGVAARVGTAVAAAATASAVTRRRVVRVPGGDVAAARVARVTRIGGRGAGVRQRVAVAAAALAVVQTGAGGPSGAGGGRADQQRHRRPDPGEPPAGHQNRPCSRTAPDGNAVRLSSGPCGFRSRTMLPPVAAIAPTISIGMPIFFVSHW